MPVQKIQDTCFYYSLWYQQAAERAEQKSSKHDVMTCYFCNQIIDYELHQCPHCLGSTELAKDRKNSEFWRALAMEAFYYPRIVSRGDDR